MTSANNEMTVVEHNAATGEVTERPLTNDEILEIEQAAKDYESQQAEKQAKAEARESALAKLATLGLTQEEIDAL